jgi:hypothetical protein
MIEDDIITLVSRLRTCYGKWDAEKICMKCPLRAGCVDEYAKKENGSSL